MAKKIKVICREFVSSYRENDVDSRMHNEDGTPIISRGGVNMDMDEYHLGQISSSFIWAVQDCGYERYKKHLDKLFPEAKGEFDFEYEFIEFKPITEYLIARFGFEKIHQLSSKEDVLDLDKFTCYKRVHEAHYLFYSEEMKHFDIAYKYDKPKGHAGGGKDTYKMITIPRAIVSTSMAKEVIMGIAPCEIKIEEGEIEEFVDAPMCQCEYCNPKKIEYETLQDQAEG